MVIPSHLCDVAGGSDDPGEFRNGVGSVEVEELYPRSPGNRKNLAQGGYGHSDGGTAVVAGRCRKGQRWHILPGICRSKLSLAAYGVAGKLIRMGIPIPAYELPRSSR